MQNNTAPRYGRPQPRKPAEPKVQQVPEAVVLTAAWFIARSRIGHDMDREARREARREFREAMTAGAMRTRMDAEALVEIAWAMARADGTISELKEEMDKARTKEQKTVWVQPGEVLEVTRGQMNLVVRYALAVWVGVHPDQVTQAMRQSPVADRLIGPSRSHLRATFHVMRRLLLPEDLAAFEAEYEKVGPQSRLDDNVQDLPTPTEDLAAKAS